MTLERDFNSKEVNFNSVVDYLLPTILLLMLRLRFLQDAVERQLKLDWPTTLILLHFLTDNRPIAVGELARSLDIGASTVSISLRKMEKTGFLFYQEDPTDRRIVYVALTSGGIEIARKTLACLAQEFREQFAIDTGLPSDKGFDESAYGRCSREILTTESCENAVFWLLSHFQQSRVMIQHHLEGNEKLNELSFLVLIAIHQTGHATPTELSRYLFVSRTTISKVISTLLGYGLVVRKRAENDHRLINVALSSKGMGLLQALVPAIYEEIADESPLDQKTSFDFFASYAQKWACLKTRRPFEDSRW